MIYTILISVVFIAELIIVITIIQNLIRLDKVIINFNDTFIETKSSIKDVCILVRKISEQWQILAQDFVDKTKEESEEFLYKKLSKILVGLLVLNLNFKFVNKIRKSRISKAFAKGWSILENMV